MWGHMNIIELTRLILGISLAICLTGCTTVQPWERGTLAKESMALDPYPQQTMYREHNYGSREGSSGGGSAKGGGCGCY
jgi:Domain of unknown function (DUF4266)